MNDDFLLYQEPVFQHEFSVWAQKLTNITSPVNHLADMMKKHFSANS